MTWLTSPLEGGLSLSSSSGLHLTESLGQLIRMEAKDENFDLLGVLNTESSWSGRLAEAIEILRDRNLQEFWERAVAVCYWALDRTNDLPIEKMELVARLYWCLLNGLEDENLVWSIAIKLNGVDYLSEWDPMIDPEVRKHLATMG